MLLKFFDLNFRENTHDKTSYNKTCTTKHEESQSNTRTFKQMKRTQLSKCQVSHLRQEGKVKGRGLCCLLALCGENYDLGGMQEFHSQVVWK